MKIIKIAAVVPIEYRPTNDTPFIYQRRVTDTETVSRTTGRRANKEYIVRVYRYDNDIWGVIAFYGRIGGSLVMDFKGAVNNPVTATSMAIGVINEKIADSSKHYRRNDENIRTDIPGRDEAQRSGGVLPASTNPSPSFLSSNVSAHIPSIRLPSEYIPHGSMAYIRSTRMVRDSTGTEWVIRVYIVIDSDHSYRYITAEWFSPSGREFRIHPKYFGPHRSQALAMAERLVEQKRRGNYRQVDDNRMAPGTPARADLSTPDPGTPAPSESNVLETPSPQKTTVAPKEDAPVKDEELDSKAKEILELLGSDKSVTKTAQTSPVMTLEMARNPLTPPKELEKVIQSLRDDLIAQTAATNPSLSNKFLSGYIDTLISHGTKKFVNSSILCAIVKERKLTPNVLSKVLMSDIDDLVACASLNPNCPQNDLVKIYKKYSADRRSRQATNILSNIASNPSIPPDLLSKIINNPKEEMRIKQVACANTNMPREVLSKIIMDGLSKGVGLHNEGIFYRSLANPNAPPALLLRISRSYSGSSLQKLVADNNPNNPVMSTVGISNYINGWIEGKTPVAYAVAAVSNPSASPNDLVAVLDQGVNHIVAMAAAKNNKTPFHKKFQWVTRVLDEDEMYANFPDIYIQWLIDRAFEAGRIQDINSAFVDRVIDVLKTMSPSAITSRLQSHLEELVIKCMDSPLLKDKVFEVPHDILGKLRLPSKYRKMVDEKLSETSAGPTEDKDDLMSLMGKNNNWYKTAQEDRYTEEVARTTTDPELLRNILRIGNNDYVSCWAARNPNCPPEVLAEVIRRGKYDVVSYYAVQNTNCPSDALAEVLRREKNNEVSYNAAHNPNCPPEDAIKWLRLFKEEIPENIIKRQEKLENKKKQEELERKRQEELERKHQEELELKELEKDPKYQELMELMGKNNSIKKQSSTNDWYCDLSEAIANDVRGYFKFIVRSNNAPIDIYNIWWKGCGSNVSISQHDLPKEEFETYKDQIMQKAVAESLKSYKEVMLSYGE